MRRLQGQGHNLLEWQAHALLRGNRPRSFIDRATSKLQKLLDAIHAALLCADDLPPDVSAVYQQLERSTRAQMMQRQLLPSRPLF